MQVHGKKSACPLARSKFLSSAIRWFKVKENMFQALIESNKGLLAAALANNNQSVPTQSLVNTYHQPGNLQRNYSYNGFNWLFFHNYFNIVTNVLMQ